jgi:hypothetical protein
VSDYQLLTDLLLLIDMTCLDHINVFALLSALVIIATNIYIIYIALRIDVPSIYIYISLFFYKMKFQYYHPFNIIRPFKRKDG